MNYITKSVIKIRIKRQAVDRENIFEYHLSDKRLVSRIYEAISKPSFKVGKNCKQTFQQRGYKYGKLANGSYQYHSYQRNEIKTTVKYHDTHTEWAKKKILTTSIADKNVEKLDQLIHWWR